MDTNVLAGHLKILGKLAYAYHNANTEEQKQASTAFFEQVASAASGGDSYDNLVLFAPYMQRWASAISNGPAYIETLQKEMAGEYLRSATFYDDLSSPPSGRLVSAIINAFAEEIETDGDKALTSGGTMVSFLTEIADLASGISWPVSASGSETHADGTYVVVTEIP